MRKLLLLIIIACCGFPSSAQFTLGVNTELGYPFYLTFKWDGFHNSPLVGGGIYASYRPANSRVYPSLVASASAFSLPVYTDMYPDLTTDAVCKAVMLNLNFKLNEEDDIKEICWYGGIGFNHISLDKQMYIGGVYSNAQLYSEGSSQFYPALNVGLKYMRRMSPKYNMYLGIEGLVKYTWLYTNGKYFADVGNDRLDARIKGHLLAPAFVISFNYMFRGRGY